MRTILINKLYLSWWCLFQTEIPITWLSCSGSTELCGTDSPQQQNWFSAWIWSPRLTMDAVPSGSIIISTVIPWTLSDGGQASITPPARWFVQKMLGHQEYAKVQRKLDHDHQCTVNLSSPHGNRELWYVVVRKTFLNKICTEKCLKPLNGYYDKKSAPPTV